MKRQLCISFLLVLVLAVDTSISSFADEAGLYRVQAAADFALEKCEDFLSINPKKYLLLKSEWQKTLVTSSGVIELVSYEMELDNLSRLFEQAAEQQVFCYKRLITLKVALGNDTPFLIKLRSQK